MAAAPIRLVVGLGNPGRNYERTRHNAGFWFVDTLARELGATLAAQSRFAGEVGKAGELRLLKPSTYMNESGRSVGSLARFLAIEPAAVLVAHDELDLPAGTVKMKQGGGVAGHNGLKDIQAKLGTPDFYRLRLGIGRPPHQGEVTNWVLGRPDGDDAQNIGNAMPHAAETLFAFADKGLDSAIRVSRKAT